jgi:hypothetical protein
MITCTSSRGRFRPPSLYGATLSYQTHHSSAPPRPKSKEQGGVVRVRCFGGMLSPVHYRRRTPRPVSYYALFKWWLLLSQHPGCHGNPTSFRTEHAFGTLAGDLGSSPFDDEAYPPPSYCRGLYTGIRSLVSKGSRVGPLSNSVALPPVPTTMTLPLEVFRRERAIPTFDDTFNPPHSSSPSFSTLVCSVLQAALPALQPGHV